MLGFNGGLLGVRKVPTVGTASGLWFQNEQSVARRAGIWPTSGDDYFAYNSLLLHMDGSNGSTTFTDSSSNALTVTANGGAQISTAQSKFGGGSGAFDGSGDYLSTTTLSPFQFGTGDFTVEVWVYITSLGSYHGILDGRTSASFSDYVFGVYNTGGNLRLDHANAGGSGTRLTGTSTSVSLNTWTHVAWVRESGVISCYVNGTKDATTVTYSSSLNPVNSTVTIGSVVDPLYFYGNIDDLRITKGAARYTANFTAPTGPFPNTGNTVDPYWPTTSLLLYMDGSNGSTTFTDSSSTPKTITVNGNAQISTAQSKFGGASGYFDGTGDYLEVASLSLDLQDFTVECWVRLGAITDCAIFNQGNSDSTGSFCLAVNSANSKLYLYADNSSRFTSTTSVSTGTWTHVALTRQNTDYKLFIDGVLDGSYTGTHNHSNTPFKIANGFGGIAQLNGYIDDARVTKGVARYTATFTPPTAAFPNG